MKNSENYALVILISCLLFIGYVNSVYAVTQTIGMSDSLTISKQSAKLNLSTYTLGDIFYVFVTDTSLANGITGEKISVTLSTTSNPSGINLVLPEVDATCSAGTSCTTYVDSGVFSNNGTIFTVNNVGYSVGDTLQVSYKDSSLNHNPNLVESCCYPIKLYTFPYTTFDFYDPNGFDGSLLNLKLNESGVNTGRFIANILLNSVATNRSALLIPAGGDLAHGNHIVQVTGFPGGPATLNALVSNTDPSVGAVPAAVGDHIFVTYKGHKFDVGTINSGGSGGGGGGGLIKPGLVIDLIAAIGGSDDSSPSLSFGAMSSSGTSVLSKEEIDKLVPADPSMPISPSTNPSIDFPLTIDGKGYAIARYSNEILPNTVNVGEPLHLKTLLNGNLDVQHFALYANLRGTHREISDSDTYIIYEKGKPLEIHDPHGFFSKVDLAQETHETKQFFSYDITFAKPMDQSDFIFRSWDAQRHSGDIKVLDAIKVNAPQEIKKSESSSVAKDSLEINPQKTIPVQNTLSTKSDDFSEAIKEWGGYSPKSISDSELLHSVGLSGNHIPSWLMKTTKWIVNDDLSQQEFLNAIQYLYHSNLIK